MELFGMWLIIIKSLRTTVYKRKKEKVETLKLLSKVLRFRSSFCLRWLVSLRSPRVFSNEFVIISPSMGKKKRTRRTEPEPNQNIWNRNRIEILKYPSCSYISILEIIEPEPEPNVPEYPKKQVLAFWYKVQCHQPHSNPNWKGRVRTLLPPDHIIFYILSYIINIYGISILKYNKYL